MSTVDPAPVNVNDQSVGDVIGEVEVLITEAKSGYKTTEFWLTIVGSVITAVGIVPVPHDTKGFVVAGLVGLYALARGFAKKGVPAVEAKPVSEA